MDTASFLCSFDRFIYARDKPAKVLSDNGTSFVKGDDSVDHCLNLGKVDEGVRPESHRTPQVPSGSVQLSRRRRSHRHRALRAYRPVPLGSGPLSPSSRSSSKDRSRQDVVK